MYSCGVLRGMGEENGVPYLRQNIKKYDRNVLYCKYGLHSPIMRLPIRVY